MKDQRGTEQGLRGRFQDTLAQQMHAAVARRVQAKVHDARRDPDRAASRWAFELLQNAHDAGPRPGRKGVAVSFRYAEGVLTFEHDAAAFRMEEVAALLTGGSSKDFASTETTGRFGTGFLVTHALAEKVDAEGVLEEGNALHLFEITLDRAGGEEGILSNMRESEFALDQSRVVRDFDSMPTARLTYAVDDDAVATTGLRALEASLPYLLGSCPQLSRVTVETTQSAREWKVISIEQRTTENLALDQIRVLQAEGDTTTEWRLVRAAVSPEARGRLLVSLRGEAGAWHVVEPRPGPRVFRQQPVFGAPSLASWSVLDGDFDVDQERTQVFVAGKGADPLREAIAAIGPLARVGVAEDWVNAHRIAHLAPISSDQIGEKAGKVWNDLLRDGVAILTELPLIPITGGAVVPAVWTHECDRQADFLEAPTRGPSHHEIWDLAKACTELDPPIATVSAEWSEIASGWAELGADVTFVDLRAIGEAAVPQTERFSDLAVAGPPVDWLAKYLEAVGRAWSAREAVTKGDVDGLLPNQHGDLRGHGDLKLDGGIDDRLKDLSERAGVDIRAQLLDQELRKRVTGLGEDTAFSAVLEVTGDEVTPDDVASDIAAAIDRLLPEEQVIQPDDPSVALSVDFLGYVWEKWGREGRDHAYRVPLVSVDDRSRRPTRNRRLMYPVATWPEPARSFSSAYPPSRVLSDRYSIGVGTTLVGALAQWGIAFNSLHTPGRRERLNERALAAIAFDSDVVAGGTAREVELSQIPLLEPEVLNYVKQSTERARSLLGLVVCHLSEADPSWRGEATLPVKVVAGSIEARVTPSLWLADLLSKPWIAVEDEDSVTHHIPNPELLRDLLDPAWLIENPAGVELLIRHFEMDALDVRLLAAAVDDEARQEVRDELARIVDFTRADPGAIQRLADSAEARERDISRMRSLGLAVQGSVKGALERAGVSVEEIDLGYDYLVSDVRVNEGDESDVSASLDVGEYKLEVKATTTAEAKLTPLQASTASNEPAAFVLCVVDLRDFPGDVHEVEWTPSEVEPRCKLLSGEDLTVEATVRLVEDAETSEVALRNTASLRYAVPAEAWADGIGLEQWVDKAFKRHERGD